MLLALVVVAVLAMFLRLDDRGRHPLHADEAVQATKLVTFLETGRFDYDPEEYHGPLPHFLSRLVLSFGGRLSPEGIFSPSEADLRLAPALAGIVVVGLVGWLAVVTWGSAGLWPAVLLASVSTSLVFYSRYFIAETFLVASTCLFLVAAMRFLGAKKEGAGDAAPLWAVLAGVGAGLMHATKETCVLSLAAAAVAGLVIFGFGRRQRRLIWLGIAGGVLTSVMLYSGGFRHWQDVRESLTTFLIYLGRAEGAGGHEQPWWFYLQRYGWFRGGYLWTEMGVFLAGLAGFVVACVRGNRPGKFLGLYAVCLVAFYCVIPYKTPWSLLPAFVALFPLAGGVVSAGRNSLVRGVGPVLIVAVSIHLLLQARRATHRMPTDPRNPYAYVHTSSDAISLVEMIGELDRQVGGDAPPRLVIADPWMAWPLPWYLRDRRAVFFRDSFPKEPTAPLLLAARTLVPDGGPGPAWNGYHRKVFGLRADLPMVLFVERELWESLLRSRGVVAK